MKNNSILLGIFILFVSQISSAAVFKNAYVSFELPPKWDCKLEKTEWVCRSKRGQEAKEAIIILTAKEKGVSDSLKNYHNHLNRKLPIKLRNGTTGSSKNYKTKPVSISKHRWIDSLHMSSEVPNYYTRYLGTVKENLGILVTFSAHRDVYKKYANDFFRAIKSLKVISTRQSLARKKRANGNIGAGAIQPLTSSYNPNGQARAVSSTSNSKNLRNALIALIIVMIGLAFVMLRNKKGQKRRRRR